MRKKTFHIVTFGCQMNVRDSMWLKACLEKRGFCETTVENASLVFVNTCSVREKPEQKMRSAIDRLAASMRPDAFFCVAGCVAQQLGEKLFEYSPKVRLVAGADGIASVPDQVEYLLDNPHSSIALLEFEKEYAEKERDEQREISSFVNIMQGCDNFCSYCIVPFTRGRQKSRKRDHVLAECRQRLAQGALELVLLGQNVNAWGKDTGEGSFAELLAEISSLANLRRLRYITPHPADMTDDVIKMFELPVLCPSLHLPLQAGSDRILKLMRRRHTAREFLLLTEKLRRLRPDIVLTTDLIVGFPGETEADFQETLGMMRECGFVSSFSFCYSDRPGTRASLMPDKTPQSVSGERLLRLQELQEELTEKWLRSRVGAEADLLLEGKSRRGEDSWQGRDAYGTIVNFPYPCKPDKPMLKVRITGTKAHTLTGEAIHPLPH